MGLTNADILYAAGGDIWQKYGTFVWRTRPEEEATLTVSRSGTARFLDRSHDIRVAESGVLRPEWSHEQDSYTLRVDRSATPVNDDSVRFDVSATSWALTGAVEGASQTAMLKNLPTNGEARRIEDDSGDTNNNARIDQAVGTFTGGEETLSAIFEEDDAGGCGLSIRDTTGGSYVIQASYDFGTDTVAVENGSGNASREILADSGPNGGTVVRLFVTGNTTSGNDRELWVHCSKPLADDDGRGTIIHHAQHEETRLPTAPIAFVGSATTRPIEHVHVGEGPNPTDYAGYTSFIATERVSDMRVWEQSSETAQNPRIQLRQDSNTGKGAYELVIHDENGNPAAPTVDLGATLGQHVEIGFAVDISTGEVRIMGRMDGGSVSDASATPSSWTRPTEWSDRQIVYNEDGGLDGGSIGVTRLLRDYRTTRGALNNAPLTASASNVLDELANHTV